MNYLPPPVVQTFHTKLNHELNTSGWTRARRHFEAACLATLNHDDATYESEMDKFRRITETWG